MLGGRSVLAFVLERDLSAFEGRVGKGQRVWKLGDQGGVLGQSWGWGVGREEGFRGSYEDQVT